MGEVRVVRVDRGRQGTYDAVQLVENGETGEFGGDGGVFDETDALGEEVVPRLVGFGGGGVGERAVVDPGGFDGADRLEEV